MAWSSVDGSICDVPGSPRPVRPTPVLAAAVLAFALVACGPDRPPPLPPGQTAFEVTIGGLSCVDCHGATPDAKPTEHWIPTGHALGGVADRPTLWGGRFDGPDRLAQAIAWCSVRFQFRNSADVGEGDPRDALPLSKEGLDALTAYVATFPGDGAVQEIDDQADFEIALDMDGDLDRGEIVWHAACAICHGTEGEGGLGPPLTGPDWADPFMVAEYVRAGTGWMPHYAPDRMTDQQLADLIAFTALWED